LPVEQIGQSGTGTVADGPERGNNGLHFEFQGIPSNDGPERMEDGLSRRFVLETGPIKERDNRSSASFGIVPAFVAEGHAKEGYIHPGPPGRWASVPSREIGFWLKVGVRRSWAQAIGERAVTRRQLFHTSGV
jgi:hypothetical protein